MVRETECIQFYKKIFTQMGYSPYTLCFDGMILSSEVKKEDIALAEDMFEIQFGYRKQLKIKKEW